MSRSANAQALHLRLFIEGVEVPVISASVTIAMNAPAQAQIDVVPTDRLLRLLPRSVVHLFYLDYEDALYGAAIGRPASSRDASYKLLFSGELFSLALSQSGFGSRSASLTCLDFSNVLDTSYLYLAKYDQAAGEQDQNEIIGNQSQFYGVDYSPFDDTGVNDPAVVIANMAATRQALSPQFADTAGVASAVLAILEFLSGVQGNYLGVNDWTTINEARVRLLAQIVSDSGETTTNLLNQKAFEEWLKGRTGETGALISFRQLVTNIQSYVYYDLVPLPTAHYRPGSRDVVVLPPPSILLELAGPAIVEFEFELEKLLAKLNELHGNTVRVRSGRRTPQEQAEISAKQSGTPYTSLHPYGLAADLGKDGVGSNFTYALNVAGMNWADADGPYARAKIRLAQNPGSTFAQLQAEGKLSASDVQSLTRAAEFYKTIGDVLHQFPINLRWGGDYAQKDPIWAQFGLGSDPVHVELKNGVARIKDLEAAAKATVSVSAPDAGDAVSSVRERLGTQLFRPDIWYAAAPVCNVVFPEEYSTLSFQRQMLRETSRLEMKSAPTLVEGTVTTNSYFAPRLADLRGTEVESLQDVGLGGQAATNTEGRPLIYQHEKFAGIVPKSEYIPEVDFYGGSVGVPTDVEPPVASAEDPNAVIPNDITKLAARSAAYNFLKYRYMPRTLSVSGRFMPRLACGFPAVVLTKTTLEEGATPTHFVGMVTSLSHSMTQGGSETAFTLSHARSHKTGADIDDLFTQGLMLREQAEANGLQVVTEIRVTDQMPKEHFNFAVQVSRFTGSIKALNELNNPPEDLVGPTGRTVLRVVLSDTTPVTIRSSRASTVDASAVADNQDPTISITGTVFTDSTFSFSGITVYEQGAREILPLEEVLRPPWISSEYSNESIGERVYQKFFGCRSVIDAMEGVEKPEGFAGMTIERAVEVIASSYSAYAQGGEANAYVHSFTQRPIATLPEVIGTVEEHGQLGFHTYAFGNFSNLENLDLDLPLPTMDDPTEKKAVQKNLDPRAERLERVLAYRDELLHQRGLRG